jgi:hypothetical protein
MKQLKITIPQSWNKCTDAQLVKIALLIASGASGIRFDYKLFKILVAAKWWQLHTKAKLIIVLRNVAMSELKPSFEYVYKANTLTRFPVIKKQSGIEYYSPLSELSNLSIAELGVADDLHIKYRNTRNTELLYYLAATLYVTQQQPRPPYDKNDLSFKVDHFRKLSIGELLVIEQAFHGCKEYMAKKFPNVFPKPKDVTLSLSKGKAKGSMFPQLILELSGGKFGDHKQTSRTNCYVFLAEFEKLLKEQKNVK